MSLLEVRDLHVWFDLPDGGQLHAVQGVTFGVDAGERIGLVGESGCGKTTTVLAILGLLPPSATVAGDVRFEGESILTDVEETVQPRRWKDIAMVFQGAMNALNPVKTDRGADHRAHGVPWDRGRSRRPGGGPASSWRWSGSRPPPDRRYPHEFSGGMRQRAALAMALACGPKVLLADEPTTALDVMVQAQILELLTGLAQDLGLALVLVTHDLPVVAQVCERAAVMYAGEIVETGRMDDLFHAPRHPYTRMLFVATPDLYGEEDVASIPGAPPRLDREIVGCPFRERCDRAFDRCRDERPALLPLGADRMAACHLNDDPVAAGFARR